MYRFSVETLPFAAPRYRYRARIDQEGGTNEFSALGETKLCAANALAGRIAKSTYYSPAIKQQMLTAMRGYSVPNNPVKEKTEEAISLMKGAEL